jgi:cation:H+ antiporter
VVTALALVAGLAMLILGAELLVRGASRLAALTGIAPLVVGLTVVAIGTSAPELAVSARAALRGQGDLALGNVIGSNIFNALAILGLSALVTPLVVSQRLVRLDVPIVIGLSVLVLVLGLDGTLTRPEGLLLCAGGVAYTVFAIRESRREGVEVASEYGRQFGVAFARPGRAAALSAGRVLVGLALLVAGAGWFLDGAVALARGLGISDLVIALTLVAAGTSLPEVAASIVAALRGERDIAVGNVIGSNVYNILVILGVAVTLAADGIAVAPAVVAFDIPVMIAVALACLPIFVTGYMITRWEGALFVGYYAAYTTYVILASVQHDALPHFSATMLAYVLPLTTVTLLVVYVRAVRRR